MSYRLLCGDALDVLETLAPQSVHCVVTSPPYFGLRDYGTAEWTGGDPECDHVREAVRIRRNLAEAANACDGGNRRAENRTDKDALGLPYTHTCGKCGAERVDSQLGLEQSPDEYVRAMVTVFDRVWRVLRDDGTVWLNLGDSYAVNGGARTYGSTDGATGRGDAPGGNRTAPPGLKPKDLVGIPWRVAFALQAAGWYLRSDIIWAKVNPMPESVTDRPTKAHEYLFLLTKRQRYYYDAEAVKEPVTSSTLTRVALAERRNVEANNQSTGDEPSSYKRCDTARVSVDRYGDERDHLVCKPNGSGRNRRSVWTIATEPYRECHFATFPQALVKPCVLAGTSERGVCPACGTPWTRVTERGERQPEPLHRNPTKRLEPSQAGNVGAGNMGFRASKLSGQEMSRWKVEHPDITTGWRAGCACDAGEPIPATVLDPFCGSGTTGLVALTYGRDFIGIDLSADYLALAEKRIAPAAAQGVLL